MILQSLPNKFFRIVLYYKQAKLNIGAVVASRLTHHQARISDEACEYPPILDMSEEAQKRHLRQQWYDSIKEMPTVEEKLTELVNQQERELEKYLLSSVAPTYSGVFFQRYVTRTHLIHGLPDKLKNMNVETELDEIRDVLNQVLQSNYLNIWQKGPQKQLTDHLKEENAGSKLANNLISQCYKKLAVKNDYILDSTIQQKPRLSSFWWHSGFETEKDKQTEKNFCYHFDDNPAFMIRMKTPLSPVVKLSDPLCATAEVPDYNYHPKICDIPHNIKFLSSVPGFWPGDPHQFPLLIVNTSDTLQKLLCKIERYDLQKIEDNVGIMSSFGCLNAVATYQGFTPFQDVTYPLVVQSILTNGQDWTFFLYQLNTIAFHNDVDNKDRRNICWSSGRMRLFDTIEDGAVQGINDDVYRVLLKFLLNAPILEKDLVLQPYLGEDRRLEEDAKNMRIFLRRRYSQAPLRHDHRMEVPTWQQIYKFHPDASPCPYIKMD